MEQPNPESSQLLCFEVSVPPGDWQKTTPAKQLPDHRAIYLTYEGPVSGNRGMVSQILKGDAQWVTRSENLLVLNLQFRWEKEKQNPLVVATLNLTKTTTETDRNWELKLQVCDLM
ncbi:MAG: hypothetical protein NTY15_06985 [Planctomycetota bacterium]|nr:hypothetical protein [Planctomycetota bacterium]